MLLMICTNIMLKTNNQFACFVLIGLDKNMEDDNLRISIYLNKYSISINPYSSVATSRHGMYCKLSRIEKG